MKQLSLLFLTLLFPFHLFALLIERNTAEDLTVIFFVNKKNCNSCSQLLQLLKSSNQLDSLFIKAAPVDEQEETLTPVPLTIVEMDSVSNATSFQRFGFTTVDNLPQYSILLKQSGQVLKSGTIPLNSSGKLSYSKEDFRYLFKATSGTPEETYTRKLNESQKLSLAAQFTSNFTPLIQNALHFPNLYTSSPVLPSDSQVLLLHTSSFPHQTSFYEARSFFQLKELVERVLSTPITTLFGSGFYPYADTSLDLPGHSAENHQKVLIKYPKKSQGSPSLKGIAHYFTQLQERETKKGLVILTGKNTQTSPYLWSTPLRQTNHQQLKNIIAESNIQSVLISDSCYAPALSPVHQCVFSGFPNQGFTKSEKQQTCLTKDSFYLKNFFLAHQTTESDYNNDGQVSLAESHTYAITQASHPLTTFTTLDSLNLQKKQAENIDSRNDRTLLTLKKIKKRLLPHQKVLMDFLIGMIPEKHQLTHEYKIGPFLVTIPPNGTVQSIQLNKKDQKTAAPLMNFNSFSGKLNISGNLKETPHTLQVKAVSAPTQLSATYKESSPERKDFIHRLKTALTPPFAKQHFLLPPFFVTLSEDKSSLNVVNINDSRLYHMIFGNSFDTKTETIATLTLSKQGHTILFSLQSEHNKEKKLKIPSLLSFDVQDSLYKTLLAKQELNKLLQRVTLKGLASANTDFGKKIKAALDCESESVHRYIK